VDGKGNLADGPQGARRGGEVGDNKGYKFTGKSEEGSIPVRRRDENRSVFSLMPLHLRRHGLSLEL